MFNLPTPELNISHFQFNKIKYKHKSRRTVNQYFKTKNYKMINQMINYYISERSYLLSNAKVQQHYSSCRRDIRIKHYFSENKTNVNNKISKSLMKCKNKSGWQPPPLTLDEPVK